MCHNRRSRNSGGRYGGPNSRAFTLIEILVVLIIIAIITAVALVSLGIAGDDRNLQNEVRRLTTLIELANDEASVLGREYGLELSATGYRFVEFDPLLNRWYEIIGDELLRPRELEPGIEFDLFIEDRRVLLENELITLTPAEPEPEQGDDEDEQVERRDDKESKLLNDYEPHVLIMSSGDVSPFELRILQPDKRYEMTLTMSLAGELEMTDNNDDFR